MCCSIYSGNLDVGRIGGDVTVTVAFAIITPNMRSDMRMQVYTGATMKHWMV